MSSPEPGWHPDPTTRHEYRYWDGRSWTDDVADRGVTATDPVDGSASPASEPNAPTPGSEPTAPTRGSDPVDGPASPGSEPTAQMPATRQYPGALGAPAHQHPPDEGDLGQGPPAGASGRGPSIGLVAALAVVAVAVIGGIAYFLTRDDGEAAAGDEAAEVGDESPTTTAPVDGGSAAPDGAGTGTGVDDQETDFLVETMTQGLQLIADGAITQEQAVCASEAILTEFDLSEILEMGDDSASLAGESGLVSRVLDVLGGCGISEDVLAGISD
jgi:hypothetical protein